jgi:hypothetical protein
MELSAGAADGFQDVKPRSFHSRLFFCFVEITAAIAEEFKSEQTVERQ